MRLNQTPLQIDTALEDEFHSSLPWRKRFVKWLSRYSPLLIYYEIPYGRASLNSQLSKRTDFSAHEWESRGIKSNSARTILRLIATVMNLPNEFIIPDDPLKMLLISDYDDFPIQSLSYALSKTFKIIYTPEEIIQLATNDNWLIEQFVRDVLSRSPQKF